MDRNQAYNLLSQHMKDPVNLNHSRESEAIMRALARHLAEDEVYWGNLGLLHDIDWEYGEVSHCKKCRDILAEAGFSNDFIEIIISHGYGFEACGPELAVKRRSEKIQHLLASAETITGLIHSSALVRPDKKLESLEVKSVKKKMKDKSFAAKVNRDVIMECENAGIPLDQFIEISLNAMKEIAVEIGL